MNTLPTGNFRNKPEDRNHRVDLAHIVIRFAGAVDLGIFVITVMSGPDIAQVAPAGITTIGAISLAAAGVAGSALRRRR